MKCSITDDDPVKIPRWVVSLGVRLLFLAIVVPISIGIVGFIVLIGILAQGTATKERQEAIIKQADDIHDDLIKGRADLSKIIKGQQNHKEAAKAAPE